MFETDDMSDAIDKDFNWEDFPYLSPEEQIKKIPPKLLDAIELGQKVKCRSHNTCSLVKHHPNHAGTWNCDRVKGAKTCLSGLNGFYQSKGLEGWCCRPCDFDMCKKCLQADIFISLVGEKRED